MEVVCRGPFRAKSFLWQPPQGAFALAIVCKATFSLAPGESPYHVEPLDVLSADAHYEDDPRRSIAGASDFVPAKKHAEVLVSGHVHSPDGRAVQSLVARLTFRDIDKALFVVGDSHIALDNAFSEPVPFSRMPLRWERASGGHGGQNPVGVRMGREARADAWGRVFLPNLRPVEARLSSRWDVLPPVGLGAIAPDWPLRLARLPHRARGWDPHRVLVWPIPPDFDMAFFNAAPPDQVTEEMTGDEQLVLENLLPGAPRFVTRLARLIPRATAELSGGGHSEVELRCDTLAIDTDREIATLVWRGNVLLDHPERAARVIIAGQAITSQIAVSASVRPPPAAMGPPSAAMGAAPAAMGPAPPSTRGAPPSVAPAPSSTSAEAAPGSAVSAPISTKRASIGPASAPIHATPAPLNATPAPFNATPAPIHAAVAALNITPAPLNATPAPIHATPAPIHAAPAPPEQATASVKETIGLKGPPPEFVLPFGVKPAVTPAPNAPIAASPAREEADIEEADIEEVEGEEEAEEPVFQEAFRRTVDLASWMRSGEAEPLPFRSAQPAQPLEPAVVLPEPARPDMVFAPLAEAETRPRDIEFAPPPTPEHAPPAPPPMWGLIQPQTPPAAGAAGDGETKVRTLKSDAPPSFDDYPIERCARVAARIDRLPEEQGAILEKDALSAAEWEFLSAHWQTAIRRESARGKTQLLTAYDNAYVGELEEQRGPITAREYARLVVAASRGTADELIDEMALPRGSFARIRRVWARRIVSDVAVAREVRLATQAAAED